MTTTARSGALRYSKPLMWSADHPASSALVLVLDDDGTGDVDILLASFDVEDAADDWLVLLPDETGLDAPICVLLESRTRIVPDALRETIATVTQAGLAHVAQALSGQPDRDRTGSPIRRPDDHRLESAAALRQLRAALERVTPAPPAPRATPRRLVIPAAAFGLLGARAASAPRRDELVVPNADARRRLTFARVGDDLEVTADDDDRTATFVLFVLGGEGPLAIALHDRGDTRRGRIAVPIERLTVSDVSLIIDRVTWLTAEDPVDEGALLAIHASIELADHATRRALETLAAGGSHGGA